MGDLGIQDLVVEYSSGGYAVRPINGLNLEPPRPARHPNGQLSREAPGLDHEPAFGSAPMKVITVTVLTSAGPGGADKAWRAPFNRGRRG